MPARHDGGGPATTLATSWLVRLRHADSSGLAPGLGHTPGVDAVVRALRDPGTPGALADALVLFAWQRAGDGDDLDGTLVELDALWDLLEPVGVTTLTRAAARHVAIDAWVDAMAAERTTATIDPLSGLHTTGYLIGRVHELDRAQEREPTALVLLVVRWPEPPGPWLRIARVLRVASALRDHVRGEATLAQVGSYAAIALLPDDARSRLERGAVIRALQAGDVEPSGYRVDVLSVPEDRTQIAELIGRLLDERRRP